jgi:hypothetical protein
VLFGEVSIESIHVPAEILCRLRRSWDQGGMNSAAAQVRAHPHPAQRWVLKPCLGLPWAGMRPCLLPRRGFGVERGKRLARRERSRDLRVPIRRIRLSWDRCRIVYKPGRLTWNSGWLRLVRKAATPVRGRPAHGPLRRLE